MFPGFDHLYQIHDPMKKRPFMAQIDLDIAMMLLRGTGKAPSEVRITWGAGSPDPGPIIWASAFYPFLSESLIGSLTAAQLSGFTPYPATVVGRNGGVIRGYFGLRVTGRCDPVDLNRSAVVVRQYPGGWFPEFEGHYFPPESWDGSDLFMERADAYGNETLRLMCTERTKAIFDRAKTNNVEFERLDSVSVNTAVYTIGLGYLLPRDFEKRVESAYLRAGVKQPPPLEEEDESSA
jgi:hypothetical protein